MLMLFHHGADRDTRNLAGETPINLVENCELQQFIVDYLVRPAAAEPVGAEPDYAEIQENIGAGSFIEIQIYDFIVNVKN